MRRRNYFLTAGLGLSAAAGLFLLHNTFAQQPPKQSRPSADKAPRDTPKTDTAQAEPPVTVGTQQLPIGQVVLFTSGVGYFQREGTVEGTTRVDLSFPVQDINDLLKSMVAARPRRRPRLRRLLRQQRPRRTAPEVLRHQPDRQPVVRRHPQPGPRREGRSRLAADQRRPAGHDDRHHRRHRDAEDRRRQGHGRGGDAQPLVRRRHAQPEDERSAARALPQPGHGQRVPQGAGDAGPVARHPEEGGEHQLRRRRQARCARRLRRREPDLEDQLSPGAGQEGEAVPARLGRGREPDGRGLEGRAHGAGVGPADLASRWTCTSRCTCRGPSSSRSCSLLCGRRPTPGHSDGRRCCQRDRGRSWWRNGSKLSRAWIALPH